jgi:osmotically-inducible protein OsmY
MNSSLISMERLPFSTGIDVPPGISVRIRNGEMTLEGVVAWNYERVRAERAVKRMRGIRSVFNNILVKPAA